VEDTAIDLDSSTVPAFSLDPEPAPAAGSPAPQDGQPPQKVEGQSKDAQKTEATTAEPDPDVIIELKRSEREHRGRASQAEQKLKTVEPVLELLRTAKDDPSRFLAEIADIVGLTPERAMEVMATAGAGGGQVELTADEKIARLERELAEVRNPKRAEDEISPEAKAARDTEMATANAVLEAAAAAYPLSAKSPESAEAAFIVRVRHWEEHGKAADGSMKPGYKPLSYAQAFAKVEAVLQRRAGAPQSQADQTATQTPQSNPGGLSNSNTGAVVPGDPNRILTDAEIREDLLRLIGR
jgi:hypothetical protein